MIHYFIHLAVLGLTYDVQDLLCITQDLRSAQTPQLWPVGSVVVVHGLSCPVACGIFILQSGPADGYFLTVTIISQYACLSDHLKLLQCCMSAVVAVQLLSHV